MTSDSPRIHDLIKFRPKDAIVAYAGKIPVNTLAVFMVAGGHVLITGQHPVSMAINKVYTPVALRFPVMFAYELDLRHYQQDWYIPYSFLEDPPGNESFPFFDLCLETMEFATATATRWRSEPIICSNANTRTLDNSRRDHTLRTALPIDPQFPLLELRPEVSSPGKYYSPDRQGFDAEVYNPRYFFDICQWVQMPRMCFEPIYGLGCNDTGEAIYGDAVAFWTSVYGDKIPEVPGGIHARSAVFGFPAVLFKPGQVKPAIESVLFDEWLLPRK
jgi:hypothetical protein